MCLLTKTTRVLKSRNEWRPCHPKGWLADWGSLASKCISLLTRFKVHFWISRKKYGRNSYDYSSTTSYFKTSTQSYISHRTGIVTNIRVVLGQRQWNSINSRFIQCLLSSRRRFLLMNIFFPCSIAELVAYNQWLMTMMVHGLYHRVSLV